MNQSGQNYNTKSTPNHSNIPWDIYDQLAVSYIWHGNRWLVLMIKGFAIAYHNSACSINKLVKYTIILHTAQQWQQLNVNHNMNFQIDIPYLVSGELYLYFIGIYPVVRTLLVCVWLAFRCTNPINTCHSGSHTSRDRIVGMLPSLIGPWTKMDAVLLVSTLLKWINFIFSMDMYLHQF